MSLYFRGNHIRQRRQEAVEYWRFFDLNQDPFSTVTDNAMTLVHSRYEHILDLLQHFIATENSLLAVLGNKGIGKTTLMKQFIGQINQSMFVHAVAVRQTITLDELTNIIQDGFRLPTETHDYLEEKLDYQVAVLQHLPKPCVLVIDNAEKLPEESLQALLYLIKQQSRNQMGLHVVLFGDHDLQAKLAKLAHQELSDELVHSIEFEPLTFEETREYLSHRLSVAGLSKAIPLSENDIKQIYQDSRGVPEEINIAASEAMINLMMETSVPKKDNFIQKNRTKLMGATVVTISLIALMAFISKKGMIGSPHFATEQSITSTQASSTSVNTVSSTAMNHAATNSMSVMATNQSREPVEEPMQLPSEQPYYQTEPVNQMQQENTNLQPAMNQAQQMNANAQPAMNQVQQMNTNAQPAMNQVQQMNANAQPAMNQVQQMNANAQPAMNQAQQMNANAQPAMNQAQQMNANAQPAMNQALVNNTVNQSMQPIDQNQRINVQVSTMANASDEAAIASAEESVLLPPKKKITKRKVQMVVPKQEAAQTTMVGLPAQIIAERPSGDYTLQLIGLSQEQAMKTFVSSNHLDQKAHYVQIRRSGNPFYVLYYGSYASREAAEQAKQSLPSNVAQNAFVRHR